MLVVMDSFSKYLWTVALREKSARSVVSALISIFSINGPPFLLHTDNEREFCNEIMVVMLAEFEVRHVRSS